MTLAITLVTESGVWASTDHRLTAHPTGTLITDGSVKQVVIRCPDGAALVSYTGLGRIGRIDISQWMREVLRGESRTVDETLIDLRDQATSRIGLPAQQLGIPHAFLAGAFVNGTPWAVEIKNWRPLGAFGGGIQSSFETSAIRISQPVLLGAGSGWAAVSEEDRQLLLTVSRRRPRNPQEFMKLLASVNKRAAESRKPGSRSVSSSATVVYMPPSGDSVQHQWFGPKEEEHLAPAGFSHMLFGIDVGEMMGPLLQNFDALRRGELSEEEFDKLSEEAARKSVQPKGRQKGSRKGS